MTAIAPLSRRHLSCISCISWLNLRDGFAADARFRRVEPMPRPKEVWTEFEEMFREQGLPIHAAAWEALAGDDAPLAPLTVPPEAEPREGVARRPPRE